MIWKKTLFSLPKGFDRDLKLLLFSMTSRRISMGFLQVVRAIFFALIGFSPLAIGLLLSVGTFVGAIHHISFGFLSDRYRRKPFLLLGAIFATSRLVIFSMTRNFWLIALGQGLGSMGEGAGAGQPVVSGYITDKIELKNRSSIFSTMAITNAVATAIGSSIAGLPQFFQNLLGLDLVTAHIPLFLIGILVSILSFILLLPISDEDRKEVKIEDKPFFDEDRKEVKIEDENKVYRSKSWGVILKFSLVRATSGIGWGFIQPLLTLYFFTRFAVGSDVLGPLFSAARIISIFSYVLIPFVVNRIGEIGAIAWSRFLSAIVTIGLAISNSYTFAAIWLLILRVLMMFTMPVRQTFATAIVNPDETATAIGVSNFARMGVRTVAPTLAGYMFEAINISMPFFVGTVFIILNGALYYVYFRPRKAN